MVADESTRTSWRQSLQEEEDAGSNAGADTGGSMDKLSEENEAEGDKDEDAVDGDKDMEDTQAPAASAALEKEAPKPRVIFREEEEDAVGHGVRKYIEHSSSLQNLRHTASVKRAKQKFGIQQ